MKKIDKKLFGVLCLFFIAYNTIRFCKVAILQYYNPDIADIEWGNIFKEYFIFDTPAMLIMVFIILFATQWMINRNYSKLKVFFLHIVFSVLSIISGYCTYYFLFFTVKGISFSKFKFQDAFLSMINYTDSYFLFYFVNVFIIYTYFHIRRSAQVELQKVQLREQLANVKVNVLKYQLHPHFFFNTLNSISSLIETDAKLAQNTLADFSDLLRDILFLKDSNLMPLDVEMKILKRYIDIMTIRFSDHLKVDIDIQENLKTALIPSLILQPIVENSIKHGYSYKSTNLTIRITIHKINNKLNILISNNGEPLKKKIKYSNGLLNTIDRLKTLYEDQYVFELKNDFENKEVITKIVIPLKKDSTIKD